MKLSNVINVWDVLHIKDTGDICFEDLVGAITEIVGVQNDIPSNQPKFSYSSALATFRCMECGTITSNNEPVCHNCRLKESESEQTIIVPYQDIELIKRTYPNWTSTETIEYGRTKVTIAVKMNADHEVFKK